MEDILKELLDTELQAEALVKEASLRHEKLIKQAQADARTEEERFSSRIPELQKSSLDKVDERVSQTVTELRGRYDQRKQSLKKIAEEREPGAIEAALALITDTQRK